MPLQRRSKNFNSASYLGSGSDISVLNRRPQKAFQKIRSVYGEHIVGETGTLDHRAYGNLSQTEKQQMKERVRRIIAKEKRRQFYSYLFFGVTCLAGLIAAIIVMNS
jgi:hypothetical protein